MDPSQVVDVYRMTMPAIKTTFNLLKAAETTVNDRRSADTKEGAHRHDNNSSDDEIV